MNVKNGYVEVSSQHDDIWLTLRTYWEPDRTYWIGYPWRKNVIPCNFLEVSNRNTLIFVDEFGIKHEIDPTNKKCRDNIKIFQYIPSNGMDDNEGFYDEEPWFEIITMPFDQHFFKLGHCYMVKENHQEDPKPMMLIGMDFEQMHFIRVADPERFKDPGIQHVYVKAERYKRMKKQYWFQALMEGDVWSNDKYKEMAEDNTEQETGSAEIS